MVRLFLLSDVELVIGIYLGMPFVVLLGIDRLAIINKLMSVSLYFLLDTDI